MLLARTLASELDRELSTFSGILKAWQPRLPSRTTTSVAFTSRQPGST
jgi:hypothetical protein